jgi:hypothetical protein
VTTLAEAREGYYELTGKASDAVRQLAFAGIAVIWVFKTGDGDAVKVPDALLLPGLLLVAALFADLLQYVLAALLWGWFARREERRGILPDDEIEADRAINWPALVLYYVKIVLVLSAYTAIGVYVSGLVAGAYRQMP